MELLRYKSDIYGQRIVEGVSWDLLWIALAAGLAFIVLHALYTQRKLRQPQNDE